MPELFRAVREGAIEGTKQGLLKGALKISGLVHIIVLCLAVRFLWPDGPPAAFALAALSGAVLAWLEIELLAKYLGKPPVFIAPRGRTGVLALIGFGLAFALAIALLVGELRGRPSATDVARQQAEQQEYYRQSREASQALEQLDRVQRRKSE